MEPPASLPRRSDVPFFNRMWVRLVLGGIGLLVMSVALTTGLTVPFATVQIRESVRSAHLQVAGRVAEEIGLFVAQARRELDRTADTVRLLPGTPWVVGVILGNTVMGSDAFESMLIVDRQGKVLAGSSFAAPDLSGFPPMALTRAAAGAAWTSGVTIDAHGLPGMAFVVPVTSASALVARLSLERIWQLIEEVDPGPGGSASVIGPDGALIASPDAAAVLRGEHRDPAVARPGSLMVSSSVSSLGWTVLIEQPVAMAYIPVDRVLRRSILVALVGLLISSVIGALGARFYGRSLDALLQGTRRIAEGDLSSRIPVPRRNEIGLLAQAFNAMAARLQERAAALRESDARYRKVTESVGDIIYALDTRRRFIFLNSRVREVLGMGPEEMLGRPMTDFVVPAHRARKAEDLRRTVAGEDPPSMLGEAHAVARDGRVVILEYESNVAAGPSGEQQVYGIARDVTQRRALEEKLRRSEKLAALGEIVSRVAHELRNAVAGIAASMTLARGEGSAEGAREDLDRALAEARRAQGIVEGLLGAPARPATREPCSINDVIGDVLDVRRGAHAAAGISVKRAFAEGLPRILADSALLRQVFHNLLDNAERALAAAPPVAGNRMVRVSTWGGDGSVCAEIADNGPGIAEEHLGRIFDPFYTTRAGTGGTGLGLSVSLGIVEATGGDITVRSAPGAGAAFTVTLPAAGGPGVTASPGPAAGRRALVVEDEPVLRDFIGGYLRNLGFEPACAAGGNEAVTRLAAGEAWDLIVSDVQMADGDGRDLFEWLRARRPGLLPRLLFLTGDGNNPQTKAFLAAAGVPFLAKPVNALALDAEVRRVGSLLS